MDEIIVRVLRTVACLARLRILSHLARSDEVAPTDMARELGLPRDLVSTHLRRLSSAGLIQRRRSGVWCYCRAQSPYSEEALSGRITLWLCRVLENPVRAMKDCGVVQLRNCRLAEVEAELHRIIFDAATAFTNVRRLQILRLLKDGDTVGVPGLSKELSMSESAVSRHTAKLVRRGYVEACHTGRYVAYRLAAELSTPVHGRLFEIVRAEWDKRQLQS